MGYIQNSIGQDVSIGPYVFSLVSNGNTGAWGDYCGGGDCGGCGYDDDDGVCGGSVSGGSVSGDDGGGAGGSTWL